MSSKSGPNGHALWTSYIDAFMLKDEDLSAISTIAGTKLVESILNFRQLYSIVPHFFGSLGNTPEITRRIHSIQDKEGKTRTIAIGDYYSQTALLPLHNYLYKLLSRINQDCTFEQTKHLKTLVTRAGSKYHSVDLTAFTDLFPIEVNWMILKVMFGGHFANAWKHLMVGIPFLDKQTNRYITYKSGNPMGMYSSWASTALAHHYILYLACQKLGYNWKNSPYMLLGDDIVIADDNLYEEYLVILESIGCVVNLSKTHNSFNGFEFAKQIRINGQNVSPFPLSALFERRSEAVTSLGIILSEIQCKDWNAKLIGTITEYYVIMMGWPRPRVKAFRPILRLVVSLVLYLQGTTDSLGKSIRNYVRTRTGKDFWKKLSKVNKVLYTHWLVVKVIQELYLESKDKVILNRKSGKLGKLSSTLFEEVLLNSKGGVSTKLIPHVPFFKVYQDSQLAFNEVFDELYDLGLGVQG